MRQNQGPSSRDEEGKTGLFLSCGGTLGVPLEWRRVFGELLASRVSRTLSRLKKEDGMPRSSPVGYIVIQRGDGVGEEKHIYIELKTEIRKVYCSRKI